MSGEVGAELRRWATSGLVVLLAHTAPLGFALGWIVPLRAAASPQPASAILLDLPEPIGPRQSEPKPPEIQPPRREPQPQPQQPISEIAPPLPEPGAPISPAVAVAAPAAPVPAVPTPSPGEITWQDRVLAHLEDHKRYPRDAQTRRQEGTASVRFVMDRRGDVLSVELRRSAGSPLLDAEAVALIRRAQPLPRPPDDVAGETLRLTVPIEFTISPRRRR
jgi:periplasmic protein TonB